MVATLFISFCLILLVKADSKNEKMIIGKTDLEELVERLLNKSIETFAKEQLAHSREQMDIIAKQENILKEQQDEIDGLTAFARNQTLGIDDLRVKFNELTNQCVSRSDIEIHGNRVRRTLSGTVVAFSATIIPHTSGPFHRQTIVFPDVITNIGNGYNNRHGIFIAPVSGLYMFSVTLLTDQSAESSAALNVNGNELVRVFEKGAHNRHGSATQTIVVHLQRGDDVSILSLFTFWGDRYSSFSGVLLQEMETETQVVG